MAILRSVSKIRFTILENNENGVEKLTALLTDFFCANEETADALFYIQDCINAFAR